MVKTPHQNLLVASVLPPYKPTPLLLVPVLLLEVVSFRHYKFVMQLQRWPDAARSLLL